MKNFNHVIELYLALIAKLWATGHIRHYQIVRTGDAKRIYIKPKLKQAVRGSFTVLLGDLTVQLDAERGKLYLPRISQDFETWLDELNIHPQSPTGQLAKDTMSQIKTSLMGVRRYPVYYS